MDTTSGEKQALRALQGFEQVRSFFLQKSARADRPGQKVRIIAFSSTREYKPYRPNEGSFAYYQSGRQRDYIVTQDIEPEHHQAAYHEYTHLIIEHDKLSIPIWLNEGLADVYSSLEPDGQKAIVGRALPGYSATLFNQAWMDWSTLFGVDHGSPYYNDRDKMMIFYAQSWLLTHMLVLGEDYSHKFPEFLAAVGDGNPTERAFQKVYGKDTAQVAKDAEAYLHRRTIRAAVFNFRMRQPELEAQVAELSDFQVEYALADLLAARSDMAREAKRRLTELTERNPQDPDLEESLGYVSWQLNQLPEAGAHFKRAVQLGSRNAGMLLSYAELEQSVGGSPHDVMELLKRSIALDSERDDARIFLMTVATGQGQYGFATTIASQVHYVKREHAFAYFAALAYCRANLKDEAGARALAQKALSYARDDGQRLLSQGAGSEGALVCPRRRPAASNQQVAGTPEP